MYRRPKFLEVLLAIREEMARESDYDVDFFAEMVRSELAPATDLRHRLTDVEQAERKAGTNGSLSASVRAPKRKTIKSR